MNVSIEHRANLLAELALIKSPAEILVAAKKIIALGGEVGYAFFAAGRACVDLGLHEEAIEHLSTCKRISSKQHWVEYELARSRLLSGAAELAFENIETFLNLHFQPLNLAQLEVPERILDQCFDLHPRSRMAALYQKLCDLGSTRYLTALRAFEGAVESGDVVLARELLSKLGWPSDAWGHLVVARFYANVDDAELAERHAIAAHHALTAEPIVAIAVVDLLIRVKRISALQNMLDTWQCVLPEPDYWLITTCAAVQVPHLSPNLFAALNSSFAHKWHFINYLYSAEGRLPTDRTELYSAIEGRFPSDPDVLMCLANIEVGQRNFGAAKIISERGLQFAQDDLVRMGFVFKLFEVACFHNDLEKASQYLSQINQDTLDSMQVAAVGRYHAERGDWNETLNVLVRILVPNSDIRADHAQLVIRAARKVSGQRLVMDLLRHLPKPLKHQQKYLAGALFEDWIVGGEVSSELAQHYASELDIIQTPLLTFKLTALAPDLLNAVAVAKDSDEGASNGSSARKVRRAVFFCADKAYVLPALISLGSLLENNPGFATADFYLVVDDEVIPAAQPVLHALARHYGVSIQAQPTSTLIPDAGKLAAGYGLFTGGHQLAAAAYYRIYMARRLAESGDYDQLLYIDSDSIILPGYDEILNLPVPEDVFLMARLEVDRAEVREAIVQHGLPQGQYFNSGILWFPRSGEALLACLKSAERAAEEQGGSLLFQDQCALNIGFAGSFAPLDRRFNYFAGPGDADELLRTEVGKVAMLHVLDRPKPWDSAYPSGTVIQLRWMAAAGSLQRIAGAEAIKPLLVSMIG